MKKLIIGIFLIAIFVISGCTQETQLSPEIVEMKDKCIELCTVRVTYENLSNGPCISFNELTWNFDDWVCDIAHSPREAVDNLPENQCLEFRKGEANHFIEITPECEFIKAV